VPARSLKRRRSTSNAHRRRLGSVTRSPMLASSAGCETPIFVFLSDDLKIDQAALVRGLTASSEWMTGAPPDFDTPHNVGGMPASMLMQRSSRTTAQEGGRSAHPRSVPRTGRGEHERGTASRAPVADRARERELREWFRDDIGKTADLIGGI